MNKTLKAVALGGVVVASALAGGLATSLMVEPVQLPAEIEYVNVTVPGPVQTVEVQVPVEKIVTVEKLVDNGQLAEVEQAIIDNKGDVSFCTNELDDDEAALVGDCLVLTNDFKEIAMQEAKKEIADLVDKEVVSGVTLDEDDVERIRLNDDLDEVTVTSLDFEDKDANVVVSGTFEHDDVKYDFEVEVEFKDGEVEDVSLESLELA